MINDITFLNIFTTDPLSACSPSSNGRGLYKPQYNSFVVLLSLKWGTWEASQGYTAEFIKKVLLMYTNSMATIYLSLSAQVAKSIFFMKSPI